MATQPFFVPTKEIDLINELNEELIDDIIGQTVDIYKIRVDETNVNMYGETVDGGAKTFEEGFRVNCLIMFNEPDVLTDEFGPDVNGTIEMYFHRGSLSGSNFYPEIGDIVDWNDFYWEMNSVTEPQLVSGHHNYKHQVKALAHRTRLTNVNLEERPK